MVNQVNQVQQEQNEDQVHQVKQVGQLDQVDHLGLVLLHVGHPGLAPSCDYLKEGALLVTHRLNATAPFGPAGYVLILSRYI